MDELRLRRRQKLDEKAPENLAEFLRKFYVGYVEDRLPHRPDAVVVLLITQDGPKVHWQGAPSHLTSKHLFEAKAALSEQIFNRRFFSTEEVEDRHKERERARQEYALAHPFECRFDDCARRFSTDKGRAVHERSCRRNPDRQKR